MWKKLENYASARVDASSNAETNSNQTSGEALPSPEEMLLEVIRKSEREMEDDSQREPSAPQAENSPTEVEQVSPSTLGAYTEAVKKFTTCVSAFIEHLPLLADAREAYEEATRASTELRKVLDSGDENLRMLMTHLEQMANIHLVNSPGLQAMADRKRPEPSKLGPVRADEAKAGMKRFP